MGESSTPPSKRNQRMTSFDVAAAAGVSQSTVSRALAGDPVVSAATRARVAEAARALNYTIDNNAARLRTGRTGTLAVVVICRPDEDRKDLNSFTYSLLGTICAAASARGFETLVSFQDSPANLAGRYEEQRKADGLIVLGTTQNAPAWDYYRNLGASGMHWVCWGSPYDELEWIRSDNHQGAGLAARHLIARGCTRIACLASLGSLQRQFKERYDGYDEAMTAAGLDPWLIPIEADLPREEQGRRAVRALIASGRAFDGVFAVCDELALGALRELSEAGIAVPAQAALIGFDGTRAAAQAMPPLSTIQPDFAAAGAMLVDKLLAGIAGEPHSERRVPVRLVPRASTARG